MIRLRHCALCSQLRSADISRPHCRIESMALPLSRLILLKAFSSRRLVGATTFSRYSSGGGRPLRFQLRSGCPFRHSYFGRVHSSGQYISMICTFFISFGVYEGSRMEKSCQRNRFASTVSVSYRMVYVKHMINITLRLFDVMLPLVRYLCRPTCEPQPERERARRSTETGQQRK